MFYMIVTSGRFIAKMGIVMLTDIWCRFYILFSYKSIEINVLSQCTQDLSRLYYSSLDTRLGIYAFDHLMSVSASNTSL